MDFDHSAKVKVLGEKLCAFMDRHIYPNEGVFHQQIANGDRWAPVALLDTLKSQAKEQKLWNLFHSKGEHGLTNLEYAPLCEIMGRVPWAAEVFNCSAPDSGNIETLDQWGTSAQKQRWLTPLLEGQIRSAFAMTEPAVASSDATNIECDIRREDDEYVINGRKWWISGAGDPRCKLFIVMGKTDRSAPTHRQQSMLLVPAAAAGIKITRPLTLFGYDDAPHGHMEILFENVRVPIENILKGEGCGFEVAQGRLGPGRLHHCMRLIGLAERALEAMCRRSLSRVAFGKPIAEQSVTLERIAESRVAIDQVRLLTLRAAYLIDAVGNKRARAEIAMIKVAAPNMAQKVIDWAIQMHGAAGLSQDFGLAEAFTIARWLRFADGPDEVHRNQIGTLELRKYRESDTSQTHFKEVSKIG